MIAASCCVGVRPSAERSSTPERLMRLQPGDADHEEFVEVAGRNRQEAHPLEQRMMRVARFLKDAAVEREPAQLAVEIARLGWRRLGDRGMAADFGDVVHQLFAKSRDAVVLRHGMSQN